MYFVGQEETTEVVPLDLESRDGGSLEAVADVSWLAPAIDPAGPRLLISLNRSQAIGGIHHGLISVSDRSTDELMLAVDVELRSLGAVRDGLDRRVLVVGADGVRGDSVDPSSTPWLDLLRRHAAWTHRASTQLEADTYSGPGWTSILTGVDANKHNITRNSGWEGQSPDYPSFLWRLRHQLGITTAAAALWPPIIDEILEPDSADMTALGTDAEVAGQMTLWLESSDYRASFIAFDGPDHAGHSEGFDPSEPAYRTAIEVVDVYLGRMLDAILRRPTAASEQWMIVYVSDHGGQGRGHGCREPDCRDIPLYFAGPGVSPALPSGLVSHMDVAPTVMSYLGLPLNPTWRLDGRVLESVPLQAEG
jgi:membrane-anchored protein YejM (alkaline phosphatase superfamily)